MEQNNQKEPKISLEKKRQRTLSNFVKKTIQPLILTALMSSNVAFADPKVENLDAQITNSEYVLRAKNANKINQNSIQPVGIDQVEYEQRAQEIVTLINQYREENGLNKLELSHNLDAACQGYANYCVENGWYGGHTSREGRTFADRLSDLNYHGFAVENIMYAPGDSQIVINGWKQSEGHNKNMLVDQGQYISIGIAKNKYGTYVTVMIIYK